MDYIDRTIVAENFQFVLQINTKIFDFMQKYATIVYIFDFERMRDHGTVMGWKIHQRNKSVGL